MISAKEVIGCRKPLVEVLLHDGDRNLAGPENPREAGVTGEHMEKFFLEHRRNAFGQRRKSGV